jgi:hypothetical protein
MLGLKPSRIMFSRVGILSVRASSLASHSDHQPPKLHVVRRMPMGPLNQRVDQAIREAEASLVEASKKGIPKPDLSSSFSAVSRAQANSLNKTDYPTPTQYNPRYQYLMKNSPRVRIVKPRCDSVKPISKGRSSSIENLLPIIAESRLTSRAPSLERQGRHVLVSGAGTARVMSSAADELTSPPKAHPLGQTARRRELFELNRQLTDPKHSFAMKSLLL